MFKRMSIILLALVVIGFTGAKCMAQTEPINSKPSAIFVGAGWSEAFTLQLGWTTKVVEVGNLASAYAYTSSTFGSADTSKGSGTLGALFLKTLGQKVSVGLFVALSPDAINAENNNLSDVTWYLANASGGMAHFKLAESYGLYGTVEYKAGFGDATLYPDRWKFGLGITAQI